MARLPRFLIGFLFAASGVAADDIDNLIREAESGNADAKFRLVKSYSQGIGTPRDPDKARYWLSMAAENGHAEAQYRMGDAYFYGQGREVDHAKALQWYERSGDQGYGPAQSKAGYVNQMGHLLGGNATLNLGKAVHWHQLAADKGEMGAQFRLGCLKYFGIGVAKDAVQADVLISAAANKGQRGAQQFMQNNGKLSEGELQKLCDIWPNAYSYVQKSKPSTESNSVLEERLRNAQITERKLSNGAIITDVKFTGSLQPNFELGCISISEVTSQFNPPALIYAAKKCIQQEEYSKAQALLTTGTGFAYYDLKRLADRSTQGARTVLMMNAFADLTKEQRDKATKSIKEIESDPQQVSTYCAELTRIGPPIYEPLWAIRHGIGAYQEPRNGHYLINVDTKALWDEVLKTRCTPQKS